MGAGLFAIPIIINKSGIIPFIFFLFFLTITQYFLHIIYAEIVLSTNQTHRLPGYVGVYLGEKFKKITLIFTIIGRHGALLAYIVLGGSFLYELLSPIFGGNLFIYTSILFFIESFIILFGLRTIAFFEFILSGLLVIIIIIITFKNASYFDIANLTLINWKDSLLPYGPVFFAISGQSAIVEVCRLLDKKKEKIKSAIAIGTVVPAILTLIFVISVVAVTGEQTTTNAIIGLKLFLNNKLIILSSLLGLFTVTTSYIIISQSLREIYWWDLKINNKFSWVLVSIVPFLLYLFGLNNLQEIIGLAGSIIGGISGLILIILLFKVKKEREKEPLINVYINKYTGLFLSSLFIFGLIYELWNFLN